MYSVGDLLTPHVDAWEQEAARMGGVLLPTLNDHVGRVYQMPLLTAVSLALVASQKWHHKRPSSLTGRVTPVELGRCLPLCVDSGS